MNREAVLAGLLIAGTITATVSVVTYVLCLMIGSI